MLYFWAQKHLLARSDLLLHIIQNKTKQTQDVSTMAVVRCRAK